MSDSKQILIRVRHRAKVLVLVGLLLGLLLPYVVWRVYWRVEAVTEWNAIKAAGYPTTWGELDAWYPETAAANPANIYIEAARRYAEHDSDRDLPIVGTPELPPPEEAWSVDLQLAIEGFIDRNRASLDLLLSQHQPVPGRYPIDLSQGADALLPHLGDTRRLGRLLTLHAIDRAVHDDPEAAIDALRAIVPLAESLAEEPVAVTQLVRGSLYALLASATGQILTRCKFTSDQLASLQASLAEVEWQNPNIRAIVSWIVLYRDMLTGSLPAAAIAIDEAAIAPRRTTFWWWLTAQLDRERVVVLQELRELLARQQGNDLPITRNWPDDDYAFSLSGILIRSHHHMLESLAATAALADAAAVGVAIMRFHRDHGRYPQSLDEVVPTYISAVPMDPFDHRPLRYRVEAEGFIVYSVGANGVDDGGRDATQWREGDVTFTFGPLQERLWPPQEAETRPEMEPF